MKKEKNIKVERIVASGKLKINLKANSSLFIKKIVKIK